MPRRCSRPTCKQAALYTLTYVYRDSTAVLGPLAAYVEPHCYDLCAAHAARLTAPRADRRPARGGGAGGGPRGPPAPREADAGGARPSGGGKAARPIKRGEP